MEKNCISQCSLAYFLLGEFMAFEIVETEDKARYRSCCMAVELVMQ
jgi:hypothetical protein